MFRRLLAVGLFSLFVTNSTFGASAQIRDVRPVTSSSGVSFDLVFNKAYSSKNISTTKERNFVQAVLNNAQMIKGKTISVKTSEIEKVFAYPFAKNVTRVRIIGKTDNPPEGTVSVWNTAPNVVRIFIKRQSSDQVVSSPVEQKSNTSMTRDAALAEVLSKTKDIDVANPDTVRNVVEKNDKIEVSSVVKPEAMEIGTKANPSRHFLRMFLALAGVLAIFGILVFVLKRYSNKLGKLPFGKKERLIQVVATHYLGGKKSIALVKVTGEYMVVGVSNDNISLISKIGAENAVDKYLEERFWNGTFEKHLSSYAKDSSSDKLIDLSDEPQLEIASKKPLTSRFDGARDVSAQGSLERASEETEDRVELSKAASAVRTGIREKLTKLKPLN